MLGRVVSAANARGNCTCGSGAAQTARHQLCVSCMRSAHPIEPVTHCLSTKGGRGPSAHSPSGVRHTLRAVVPWCCRLKGSNAP